MKEEESRTQGPERSDRGADCVGSLQGMVMTVFYHKWVGKLSEGLTR